ncbi:hypothetical protein, partial [Xanthobacter autotrophicus]|uniref:hypothetical protein n=1 Tax=Xanthobacter autotrophicus TaxID=280 RepID=UPI00372B29E7
PIPRDHQWAFRVAMMRPTEPVRDLSRRRISHGPSPSLISIFVIIYNIIWKSIGAVAARFFLMRRGGICDAGPARTGR